MAGVAYLTYDLSDEKQGKVSLGLMVTWELVTLLPYALKTGHLAFAFSHLAVVIPHEDGEKPFKQTFLCRASPLWNVSVRPAVY